MTKKECLEILIEKSAFAPSASALARNLGYKGKNTLYSILRGEAGEVAINKVWNKLQSTYDVSSDDLYNLAHQMLEAQRLASLDADLFLPMLHFDEEAVRAVLSQDEWNELLLLSKQSAYGYAQWLVLYYIYKHKYDQSIKGQLSKIGIDLLKKIYQGIQPLQPEQEMLADMYKACCSELEQYNEPANLWFVIQNPSLMVQAFINPDARLELANTLRLLPVGDISFWLTPEAQQYQYGRVFMAVEFQPEGAVGGKYMVLDLDISPIFVDVKLNRVFEFWMMRPVDATQYDFAYVQSIKSTGEVQVLRLTYLYQPESQTLLLDWVPGLSEKFKSITLPRELYWVNEQQRKQVSEKLWINAFKKIRQKDLQRLIGDAVGIAGLNIASDYEVLDVRRGRTAVELVIQHKNEEPQPYVIALSKYPSLANIDPAAVVIIVRREDKSLCAVWVSPHIEVPLDNIKIQVSPLPNK